MEGPRKKLSGMFPTGSVSKKHLEEEIKAMSSANAGMDQKLQELRNKLLQQQQLNQQTQRYRQDMEKDMFRLDGEISTLRDDKVTLYGQIHQLSEKLAAANKEIEALRNTLETSTGRLFDSREEVLSAQAQIDVLSTMKKDMGQIISAHEMTISILNGEKKDLLKQAEYLEEMVAWLKKQHTVLKLTVSDQHASMTATESEVEPNIEGGRDQTAELQSRMQALRPENAFLKQTCVELRTEISSLRNNTPKTLRSLLVMRYLDIMYPLSTNEPNTEPSGQSETWFDDRAESSGTLEATHLLNLLQTSLDIVYSPAEFDEVAAILRPDPAFDAFYKRIQLRTCALCTKPRIGGDFHDSPLSWIDEFPARGNYFACCHAKTCRKCLIGYLIGVVQYEWWHHLGSLQWLFCPVAGCERALNIRCEADFQLCLERNRDAEVEEHVKMFGKALILRQALEELDETPSAEALRLAAKLHEHLAETNKMYNIFDPRFDPTAIDESGCLPEFDPGTVLRASLDNISSKIPLFVKFFRRKSTAKDCIICVKAKYEVDYEDSETWRATCDAFKGRWMWDILVYPTREIQNCDHDFDVCRSCTAEHISSMLKNDGPAACEKLSCPQCDRRLSHQEVTHLADTKTLEQYEKFLLQNTLSKEPNFRWCLRPGCPSGQLYLRPPRNKRIECEECSFQMCFTDQVPWHTDLSCSEWKSQKDHGDPQFLETQDWLSQNTKACPGCSRSISKAGGCFHMTCKYCPHQFCWECLADYTLVREQGQEGHNPGCYFRNNSISPMSLRGSTLEEALHDD